ncbi:MAG: flagellar motor switch protein FliM [Alphaproteobacteria bacterium]|nr:flagellar motor switch protein FliM [Alphaproteobacteria bacterium]
MSDENSQETETVDAESKKVDTETTDQSAASQEKNNDWTDIIAAKGGLDQSAAINSSSKILNQEEIDALFGYSEQNRYSSEVEKTGVKAILNSSMVSYERLPMLDIVFDRLIRMMSTSLRNFTQDNVDVSLDSIESMRFGEYIDALTLPTLLGVFKAEEWDNYGLISIDSSLVYSIVDVLLGGRRGTAAVRIEGRPYTTIELNLVKDMLDIILADLSTAFDPVTSVNFTYDRMETNPRFATISRLSNAVIVARLRVDMEDRGGKVDLMIPYATLEPIRDLLLQMFMGERYGRDMIWENHLVERLWNTDLDTKVILKELEVPLGEIAKWEPGSFLPLDMSPHDKINLICGDVDLFSGLMGRKGDNIVIKVTGKAHDNG